MNSLTPHSLSSPTLKILDCGSAPSFSSTNLKKAGEIPCPIVCSSAKMASLVAGLPWWKAIFISSLILRPESQQRPLKHDRILLPPSRIDEHGHFIQELLQIGRQRLRIRLQELNLFLQIIELSKRKEITGVRPAVDHRIHEYRFSWQPSFDLISKIGNCPYIPDTDLDCIEVFPVMSKWTNPIVIVDFSRLCVNKVHHLTKFF